MNTIEWNALDAERCIFAVEMLLDEGGIDCSLSEIENATTRLLHLATDQVSSDTTMMQSISCLCRDICLLFPSVASVIIDLLPSIQFPLPLLEQLPTILVSASQDIIESAVSALKTILRSNSILLFPILNALCELSDSCDLRDVLQSLINEAVKFVQVNQLQTFLSALSKCPSNVSIEIALSKLRFKYLKLSSASVESSTLLSVLLQQNQYSTNVLEVFINIILAEIIEVDIKKRPHFFDFAMVITTYNLVSSKTHSKCTQILNYWYYGEVFPFDMLVYMIQQVKERSRGPCAEEILVGEIVWRVLQLLVQVRSKQHVEQQRLLSTSESYEASTTLTDEVVQTLLVVFYEIVPLQETIRKYLVESVFETDDFTTASNTKHSTAPALQLPPLGDATALFIKKLNTTLPSRMAYSTSDYLSRVLHYLALSTSSSAPSVTVSIGSSLYTAIYSRLNPDHDGYVTLLPKHILNRILRIVILAGMLSSELESALMIMVQKLLGISPPSTSLPLLACCLDMQRDLAGIESTPDPRSNVENTEASRASYTMSEVGVKTACSFLLHHERLQAEDRRAIVHWLLMVVQNSLLNSSIIEIVNCFQILLHRSGSTDASTIRDITCCFDLFFKQGSCLQLEESVTPQEDALLFDLVSSVNASPTSPKHTYKLQNIVNTTVRYLDDSKIVHWRVALEEVASFLYACSRYYVNSARGSDTTAAMALAIEVTRREHLLADLEETSSTTPLEALAAWSAGDLLEGNSSSTSAVTRIWQPCLESIYAIAILLGVSSSCLHSQTYIVSVLHLLLKCRRKVVDMEIQFVRASKDLVGIREMHSVLNKFQSLLTIESLESVVTGITTSKTSSSVASMVLTDLSLSLLSCLVVHSNAWVHPRQSENSFLLFSTTRMKAVRQLDTMLSRIEYLRRYGEDNDWISTDVKESQEQLFLPVEGVGRVSSGSALDYHDSVRCAVSVYTLLLHHIQSIRASSPSSEEFISKCQHDAELKTLAEYITCTATIVLKMTTLSENNSSTVSQLYGWVEHQVKSTLDSLVAKAGFRVLTALSSATSLAPRHSALAFLLSTLAFTHHTALLSRNNSTCADYSLQCCVDTVSFQTFSSEILLRLHLQTTGHPAGKLLISLLKHFQNRKSGASDEVNNSIDFYLAWWLTESIPLEKTAGIILLLMDVLRLFQVEDSTPSRTRRKNESSPQDVLSTLVSPLRSSAMQTALLNITPPAVTADSLTTPNTTSSIQKKLRCIIVDDEDEEIYVPTGRKRIRAIGSIESKRKKKKRARPPSKSFTSLNSNTATIYFEIGFLLLPSTLSSCSPVMDQEEISDQSLQEDTGYSLISGPYREYILNIRCVIWMLLQLSTILKQEEQLRFLIETSVVVVRGCISLIETLQFIIVKCIQWRNEQEIQHTDNIGVQLKDSGALQQLSILFAWCIEMLLQMKLYFEKFKTYFMEDTKFEIPKSLNKSLPAVISKCERCTRGIETHATEHSISVKSDLLAVRRFIVENVTDTSSCFMQLVEAFKRRTLATVESPLQGACAIGHDVETIGAAVDCDIGTDMNLTGDELKFEVQSSTNKTGWGMYS